MGWVTAVTSVAAAQQASAAGKYNQAVQNQNARAAYGQSQSNNMFNLAGTFLGLGRK